MSSPQQKQPNIVQIDEHAQEQEQEQEQVEKQQQQQEYQVQQQQQYEQEQQKHKHGKKKGKGKGWTGDEYKAMASAVKHYKPRSSYDTLWKNVAHHVNTVGGHDRTPTACYRQFKSVKEKYLKGGKISLIQTEAGRLFAEAYKASDEPSAIMSDPSLYPPSPFVEGNVVSHLEGNKSPETKKLPQVGSQLTPLDTHKRPADMQQEDYELLRKKQRLSLELLEAKRLLETQGYAETRSKLEHLLVEIKLQKQQTHIHDYSPMENNVGLFCRTCGNVIKID